MGLPGPEQTYQSINLFGHQIFKRYSSSHLQLIGGLAYRAHKLFRPFTIGLHLGADLSMTSDSLTQTNNSMSSPQGPGGASSYGI